MTPPVALRCFSALDAMDSVTRAVFLERTISVDPEVHNGTAAILSDVGTRGDAALRDLALRFDGVSLDQFEVPRPLWSHALDELAPQVRRAMEHSAENIATVHRAFLPTAAESTPEPGVLVGRRPDPLRRVGVYAPGGRAAYPSSVLMGVVPARVAGVEEIVVCSPPGPDGLPNRAVLAAAALAGAHRMFALGGAGAIGAMAFGTETVPRVDRIVGPGNAYVAEAKLQVAGLVSIDSPAGPSELLVIADAAANPETIAAEMLAQAEHDPRACVVAVVQGAALGARVRNVLADLLPGCARRALIEASLAGQGAILWVNTLDVAIDWSNTYAPEHLLLCTATPDELLPRLRNAGTIFLGTGASVSHGDYMTGANHVLPTGGLARSYSGLSTLDFFRWTTYQRIDTRGAARLASDVGAFAQAEGLPGHAAAVSGRNGDR